MEIICKFCLDKKKEIEHNLFFKLESEVNLLNK